MPRYERVIFLDGPENAAYPLKLLDEDGVEAAKNYLEKWHYPGEHMTDDDPSHGAADNVHFFDDGYILSWNPGLEYIGLDYDTEPEDNPDDDEDDDEDEDVDDDPSGTRIFQ